MSGFTYVITSYHHPNQLYRLLARLRTASPEARLVVSHDRKATPLDGTTLAALRVECRATPTPVTWGDDSYLRSVLAVFSLLDLAPDDWVTVLSGQDYPLRPLREYEEHLASCGADMLLEEPQNGPDEELLLDRYRARSYSVPAWAVNRWLRKSVQLVPGLSWHPQPSGSPPRVDVARLRTPFRHGFRVHRGNDLYALNGRALRALLNAPPRLLRYYSRTRIPSESYTHTVLLNDPSLVNRNELLHFAVWERSSHPEWLTEADLPACIASRRWFARKFDADEPVLDRLDALLGPQG